MLIGSMNEPSVGVCKLDDLWLGDGGRVRGGHLAVVVVVVVARVVLVVHLLQVVHHDGRGVLEAAAVAVIIVGVFGNW